MRCDGQYEPTEYNNIDGFCKTTSDMKVDNKCATTVLEETQTSDATVKSSVLLSTLRPCSVVLSIININTHNKQNTEVGYKRKSSNDTKHRNQILTPEVFDCGKTVASEIDQQSTRDSEVDVRMKR